MIPELIAGSAALVAFFAMKRPKRSKPAAFSGVPAGLPLLSEQQDYLNPPDLPSGTPARGLDPRLPIFRFLPATQVLIEPAWPRTLAWTRLAEQLRKQGVVAAVVGTAASPDPRTNNWSIFTVDKQQYAQPLLDRSSLVALRYMDPAELDEVDSYLRERA